SLRNLKLIQSVMLISGHLKFEVIAEGIDSNSQLESLKEIECIYGQGRFLEPPQLLPSMQINTETDSAEAE
ncbi:MAG: EAL domain-containing protein, partial [Aestuariibacter sp.]|nr:EAL domain-containing protein [Aestuariibacter sp.]